MSPCRACGAPSRVASRVLAELAQKTLGERLSEPSQTCSGAANHHKARPCAACQCAARSRAAPARMRPRAVYARRPLPPFTCTLARAARPHPAPPPYASEAAKLSVSCKCPPMVQATWAFPGISGPSHGTPLIDTIWVPSISVILKTFWFEPIRPTKPVEYCKSAMCDGMLRASRPPWGRAGANMTTNTSFSTHVACAPRCNFAFFVWAAATLNLYTLRCLPIHYAALRDLSRRPSACWHPTIERDNFTCRRHGQPRASCDLRF